MENIEKEFVSRVGDVVVLENNQKCLVLDNIYLDSKYYLNLAVISPDKIDNIEEYVSFKFVEEVVNGDQVIYRDVEDKSVISKLLKLQNEYKNQ